MTRTPVFTSGSAQAPPDTASGTAGTIRQLAGHHLGAAAEFARQLRAHLDGKVSSDHLPALDDHRAIHLLTGALIMSVASIEANINERLFQLRTQGRLDNKYELGTGKRGKDIYDIYREKMLPRCKEIARSKDKNFPKDSQDWKNVDTLCECRNRLIHFEAGWGGDLHHKNEDIQSNICTIVGIPHFRGSPFPWGICNYQVARYALRSALDLEDLFARLLEEPNRLAWAAKIYQLPLD